MPSHLNFPLGDSLEVVVRREDAEGFIERCAATIQSWRPRLWIEERELEAGLPN